MFQARTLSIAVSMNDDEMEPSEEQISALVGTLGGSREQFVLYELPSCCDLQHQTFVFCILYLFSNDHHFSGSSRISFVSCTTSTEIFILLIWRSIPLVRNVFCSLSFPNRVYRWMDEVTHFSDCGQQGARSRPRRQAR